MELNRFCCNCKNYVSKRFTDKIIVWSCKEGLNTSAPLCACIAFEPRYIDDTIPDSEKKYHCHTCKYSSLEYIDGVGFIDKCNNLTSCNEILCNTMSKYKCKYYELDPEKLPVPKSILDLI